MCDEDIARKVKELRPQVAGASEIDVFKSAILELMQEQPSSRPTAVMLGETEAHYEVKAVELGKLRFSSKDVLRLVLCHVRMMRR